MRIKNSPSHEIAEFLYRTDSDESDSEVTSSHWQKYSRFSAAYRSKTGDLDFNASGREGLGVFKKATMFARLKNLPSSQALNQILKNISRSLVRWQLRESYVDGPHRHKLVRLDRIGES